MKAVAFRSLEAAFIGSANHALHGQAVASPNHLDKGGMTPILLGLLRCRCEMPAADAKRLHAPEGHESERRQTSVPEATD